MVQYNSFTDDAVLKMLGQRVAEFRLRSNWTQADLAFHAGVSKSTVEHLERGQSVQILNFVKVVKACGFVNQLLNVFPQQGPSPMELLRASKAENASRRKRASKPRGGAASSASVTDSRVSSAAEPKVPWVWGEDK